MPLVEAARFGSRAEAEVARGAVEAAGIDAVLFDTGMSVATAFLIPVRLMVLEEDLAATRCALAGW